MNDQTEHTYQRLSGGLGERVHSLALHLEVHSQFGGMALDAEQAQHMAAALRSSARIADDTSEAYNLLLDRIEMLEHSITLADTAWDKLFGLLKSVGIILAIGALVGLLNWLGR